MKLDLVPIFQDPRGLKSYLVNNFRRIADLLTDAASVAQVTDAVATHATSEAVHIVGAGGEPAFQNAWAAYGAPFLAPGFYKDTHGRVHLQGLATGGTAPNTVFTLPTGYRPSGQVLVAVQAGPGFARIEITAAGIVYLNNYISGGSNAYLQLDAISFRAA